MTVGLAVVSSRTASAEPLDLRDLSADVQKALMAVCEVKDGRIRRSNMSCLRHHTGAWRRLAFKPEIGVFNSADQRLLREGCEDVAARGPVPWARCIEQEMVRLKVPLSYPDLSGLKDEELAEVRRQCAPAGKVSSYREASCQEIWRDRLIGQRPDQQQANTHADDDAPDIRTTATVAGPAAVASASEAEVRSVEPSPMTGGLVGFGALDPDSDYWPDWGRGAGYRPAAISGGDPLPGHVLFDRVAPSVFVVLAAASEEDFRAARHVRQGSAVAISEDRLATNCHTVKDVKVLVLLQGRTHGSAELVHADPSTDRCILRSLDLTLRPVPGIRDFSDLHMAERVYAIAAPRGLQQSMQDGIVSQLRTNAGVNLIQTSAYAAPGSSGGGLFDAYGNLIGITNFIVGNDDRLHFAIAADEFWK